jgi:hypothetical protein
MNAVFIAVPAGHGRLSEVAGQVAEAGYTVESTGGEGHRRLFVKGDHEHVWIFNEKDPGEMPHEFGKFVQEATMEVLALEYYSLPLAKRIVELLAKDDDSIVDNDNGTSLAGPKFIERLRAEPSWDWRTEPTRAK